MNYSEQSKGGRPPFDPVFMFKIVDATIVKTKRTHKKADGGKGKPRKPDPRWTKRCQKSYFSSRTTERFSVSDVSLTFASWYPFILMAYVP
jgi:hypothetical protein